MVEVLWVVILHQYRWYDLKEGSTSQRWWLWLCCPSVQRKGLEGSHVFFVLKRWTAAPDTCVVC